MFLRNTITSVSPGNEVRSVVGDDVGSVVGNGVVESLSERTEKLTKILSFRKFCYRQNVGE